LITEILINIPVDLTPEKVDKALHLRAKNPDVEEIIAGLISDVIKIAKPKALYRVAYIDSKDADTVTIEGVKFDSHILRHNLDKVERVFPYTATCGIELDEFKSDPSDVMKAFCLDTIKRVVTSSAIVYLTKHLKQKYALGQMSHMNPGSLEDWPITQQKQLFSLFNGTEQQIGVHLSENCLMHPLKSVSGIYFPTEVSFESCQLCRRDRCIGRRAPYSPDNYTKSVNVAENIKRKYVEAASTPGTTEEAAKDVPPLGQKK
jgi:hypothetical protein